MNYLTSYIKAIKWIISIITFKEEKISEISYKDEFYEGLNGQQTEVRVFYSNKKTNQSVILFPAISKTSKLLSGR